MAYHIDIKRSALKSLAAINRRDATKISDAIDALKEEPRPHGVVKLTGHQLYRIRVGDYRIVYEIDNNRLIVHVITIAHRKDVYRDLD